MLSHFQYTHTMYVYHIPYYMCMSIQFTCSVCCVMLRSNVHLFLQERCVQWVTCIYSILQVHRTYLSQYTLCARDTWFHLSKESRTLYSEEYNVKKPGNLFAQYVTIHIRGVCYPQWYPCNTQPTGRPYLHERMLTVT